LFVITVILIIFVRCKHEVLMINYAKPNQKVDFVRYNREFVITVIVITEFDCILKNIKSKYVTRHIRAKVRRVKAR
jgi:hypothetical protein